MPAAETKMNQDFVRSLLFVMCAFNIEMLLQVNVNLDSSNKHQTGSSPS